MNHMLESYSTPTVKFDLLKFRASIEAISSNVGSERVTEGKMKALIWEGPLIARSDSSV